MVIGKEAAARLPKLGRPISRRVAAIETQIECGSRVGVHLVGQLMTRFAEIDEMLNDRAARLEQVEADVRAALEMSAEALTKSANLMESADELDENSQRIASTLRTVALTLLEAAGPIMSGAPRTTGTG